MTIDNTTTQIFSYPGGSIKTAVLFPGGKEAALASLGVQTAFHLFNSEEDFSAQLVWNDKTADSILVSAEIIAVSAAFELDIIQLAAMLRRRGMEIFADKRKGPFVVIGGVLTLINPRILAPLADLILIGDGELLIPPFAEIYRNHRYRGKDALLQACAEKRGFWIPGKTDLEQTPPAMEKRRQVLHSALLDAGGHFGKVFLVEVGRGCPRRCKFCVSGHIHGYEYHPAEKIIEKVEKFAPPGCKIGLIGSAVSDYPQLEFLLEELLQRGYPLATSSLRADVITEKIARLLAQGGVNTVTIAPEAGNLRLRKQSGKGMSDNLILRAAENSAAAGIERLKLYFMIGLPGETEEDIVSIADLTNKISRFYPPDKIELSVNGFIPKPGTAWSEFDFAGEKYLRRNRKRLRELLPQARFTRRAGKDETVQALFAKGDEQTVRDYMEREIFHLSGN